LGAKAKVIGQPVCRTSEVSRHRSSMNPYVDFTVVSNYLEGIVLVVVLIALGIGVAVLNRL
jgi:hypothetical protein